MKLQFANAWILYLLWLVPAIAAWWYASFRQSEKNLESFVSALMQAKLRPAAPATRFKWQIGLITSAMFLAMLAAARPQWGQREETVYQRSRDIIIALDVSRSMLANDVYPNRLQRAKADVMDLIKELNGDRAALLAFRKTAVLLCPLTTDYSFIRQALDAVTIDSAPAGETNIGDALAKAMEALEGSDEGAHKAIVLISDGEDLSGQAMALSEKAAEKKIPVFTVGLGSATGSKIPEEAGTKSYAKYKGEDIVTKMNFETLKSISEKTGGAYIGVGTASMTSVTLGTLYNNYLRNINAREVEETRKRQYVERYQYFLFPAVLLMLAACFLSRGRLSKGGQVEQTTQAPSEPVQPAAQPLPPPVPAAKVIALALITSLTALQTQAETNSNVLETASTNSTATAVTLPRGREGARLAQNLYMLGKYTESANAYLEAAKSQTDNAQRNSRFNAAVSLYKAGQHKAAADLLKEIVLGEKQETPETDIALGASLYESFNDAAKSNAAGKAELLKQAGEAFKVAARNDRYKDESLKNLAVILNAIPSADQESLIARMMAKYGSKQASEIADEMLANQRSIMTDIPAAFSNDSPARVAQLEAISKRQKENSELWIPLKGKLLEEISRQPDQTNSQQYMAFVNQASEMTRDKMKNAAADLRDLNPDGFNDAAASETVVYQFWKAIAPYSTVLKEDIRRQTNSISLTRGEKPDGKRLQAVKVEQEEAAQLTKMFEERFTAAFPGGGIEQPMKPQAGNGDTNQPAALSPEDRAKIIDLTQQAKGLQSSALGLVTGNMLAEALETENKAYEVLKEIEKLLPKDKKQQQDKQQDQKSDKDNQDDKDQKPDQQQPQPKDQKKEEPKKSEQEKKDKQDLSEEQLKAMLDKAVQREKEHEEERRQRNRKPPIGVDKDW